MTSTKEIMKYNLFSTTALKPNGIILNKSRKIINIVPRIPED
jgi:hypothetical protein